VLRNGMTSFTRDISIGGNHYTDAIQKEFGLSAEQAERVKTGQEGGADPEAVRRVMDTVSENIAVEIQRSFDFFGPPRPTRRSPDPSPAAAPGSTSTPFSASGSRSRSRSTTLQNLKINPKKFDVDFLKENAPAAAVAVGLALRKAGDR
jgi:type IV pilus assembly protein PilM